MVEKGLGKSHLGVGKLSSGSTHSGVAPIRRSGPGVVIGLEVEEDAGKIFQ